MPCALSLSNLTPSSDCKLFQAFDIYKYRNRIQNSKRKGYEGNYSFTPPSPVFTTVTPLTTSKLVAKKNVLATRKSS